MMKIYRTQDKQLTRVDDMNEGAWICLTNPTDDEVRRVAATLDIEPADIVAATDPEVTDMVVTPKIMGKAMGLNPAILLLSLSVWGALLGFLGLIVALPLTTLIIAYWQRYVTKEKPQYHEKTGENVPISDKNEENQ